MRYPTSPRHRILFTIAPKKRIHREQVDELKRALTGSEKGMMATLVREAAAPLQEQEAEVQALREELARQRAITSEVYFPASLPSQCSLADK
jgi:hypothetical protein